MRFLKRFSLRKRIYLLLSLILCLLLGGIGIFLLTKPQGTGAAWWDETWLYRREINLNNPNSEIDNAQIKIFDGEDLSPLVNEGKLDSTLKDLRFTDSSGNLLPYYIENDTNSAVEAWVLIRSLIEGPSTIFMYYGKSSATDLSSSIWMADLGGEISSFGTYRIHAFTDAGSDTYTNFHNREVDILVVAGGGGGGYRHGAGGGAGGLIFQSNFLIEGNTSVLIGSGGNGATGTGAQAQSGENTSFGDLVSLGGGAGGQWDNYRQGLAGGSGGGSSTSYSANGTSGQGNNGGQGATSSSPYNWGGGGGAGEAGASGTSDSHGDGGDGLYYGDFFTDSYGENGWFAGGGGGGGHDPTATYRGVGGNGGGGDGGTPGTPENGGDGIATTGGGGGGASTSSGGSNRGGDGASGIVLLRYESDINTPTNISIDPPSSIEEITPGPIAFWKFDEGTGTTAYDSSGQGINGSVVGTPSWQDETSCVSGPCMQFNASEYVDLGNPQGLQITGSQTISMWLKPANFSARRNPYAKAYGGEGTITQETSGVLNYYYGTAGGNTTPYQRIGSSQSLTLNEWNHVTLVRDLENMKLYWYINGVKTNETTANYSSATASGLTAYIGNGYTSRYDGLIDEVKIYPYARTADQIKTDYITGSSAAGSKVVLGDQAETSSNPPLEGNLIGYWRFDNGAGTTLKDSSSSGIDGSILGASWTTDGRIRRALSFDGIDDYVDLTNSFWGGKFVNLDGNTTDFSISAWIKLDSYPTEYTTIVGQRYGDTMTFGIDPSGKVYLNMDDTRTASPKSNSTIPLDKWTHVAVSFEGTGASDSTAYFYVNGQSDGSGYAWDGNGSSSQNYLYIGWQARPDIGADSYFPGLIDELRIYDTSLNQQKISIDYNKGMTATLSQSPPSAGNVWGGSASSQYCIPGDTSTCSPPVGEWLLDDNQGSTAKDTSGNGNDGTLVNSPIWSKGLEGTSSLKFNGANSSVTVSDSIGLRLANTGFTISMWGYWDSLGSSSYPRLIDKSTGTARVDPGWKIYFDSNRSAILGITGGGDQPGIIIPSQKWFHFAWTADGADWILYLNGKEVSKKANSYLPSDVSPDLNIGNSPVGERSWDGLIDQVRIYDYARTPAQIAWDYDRGKPVGHWRLDECQGSTIHDVTGNGNHGSITIGPTGTQDAVGTCTSNSSTDAWSNGKTGKLNSSLSLDGTDDQVVIPNSQNYQFGTKPFTISIWANPSTAVANYDVIFSKSSNLNHYEYVNSLFSAYGELRWYLAHNSETLWNHYVSFGANANFTNEWNHFLLVRDGTTIKGYLNGELADESTLPTDYDLSNSYDIQLGKEGSIGTYFDGRVDDLRIYNYALTPKQIQLLYNDNAAVRF